MSFVLTTKFCNESHCLQQNVIYSTRESKLPLNSAEKCAIHSEDINPTDLLISYIWWLVRVTLMVAFGFLPHDFGWWWGPTNDGFAKKINAAWVVGTPKTYLWLKKKTFCTFRQQGHKNFGWALMPIHEPLCLRTTRYLVEFSLPHISNLVFYNFFI